MWYQDHLIINNSNDDETCELHKRTKLQSKKTDCVVLWNAKNKVMELSKCKNHDYHYDYIS